MIRTTDAALLNRVANDPAIRPHLGGEGPLDLQPLLSDPRTIALVNEHGGFVFHAHDNTRYEMHTLFLPSCRGKAALWCAAWAFRHLFTTTDCAEIVTKAPASNPAADFMARRAGFRPLFRREAAWPDGSAITYFTLTLDEWRGMDATLPDEGHAFHELIETAKRSTGSALPIHPDDDAHDRAAGLSALMARGGQPQKAVWAYNRWAALAGYAPVRLLSLDPPIIDIQDAVLGLRAGELEVLICR